MRKRQRSFMRRTTSMTEFDAAQLQPSDEQLHLAQVQRNQRRAVDLSAVAGMAHSGGGGKQAGAGWLDQAMTCVRGASSGRRRYTGDFAVAETAPFLMACGLCKRRLGPGRDTFIYRGDIAFCSLECRQLHINQDEQKEKCSLICMKDAPPPPNGSEDSEGYGTAAAA